VLRRYGYLPHEEVLTALVTASVVQPVKASSLSALGDAYWRAYANSADGFWPPLEAALRAAVRLAGGEVEESE
jgi:hypothetical protein